MPLESIYGDGPMVMGGSFESSMEGKTMEDMPILPLGSVVHLVNGDESQRLMIVGRGTLTEHEGVTGYLDYAAVLCPNGLIDSDHVYLFNREDVKDVVFVGFRDAREQLFEDDYDRRVAATRFQKLHVK
ncbi:MAG: DUF4176 domain-containing protein [Pseudoscardovia radai]|nr:DUF4176 domain-containing protein [Pseudoscardovia radai]